MSKLKSKIDFKPTTMDAYDGKKISYKYLGDEFGQYGKLDPDFDFHKILKEIKGKPNKTHLIFQKPKKR